MKQIKETKEYFDRFLHHVKDLPDEKVCAITHFDTEFGYRIRDAGYAVSIFMNPIFRGVARLRLGKCSLPSEKKTMHASMICAAYNGVPFGDIDKKDVKELMDICGHLIRVDKKLSVYRK
jgi:hypothetical protein